MVEPLKIIFPSIAPSKKNSKRTIYRGGRMYLVSSENHEAWHEETMWLLKKVRVKFTTASLIKITSYPKDRIRRDNTNVAESVMDILKDAGIIPDDNWFVAPEQHLKFGGIDLENPRMEVEIFP